MQIGDNRIEIALPSDQNYIHGLLVTGASIARHAAKDDVLSFHILDGGIQKTSFDWVCEIIQKNHEKSEFNRIDVASLIPNGLPSWGGNRMTYARLLLAQALPELDYVIYCDSDYLWLCDIGELWRQREREIIFIGTHEMDGDTVQAEKHWFASHGLAFNSEKYFCAGLSFYNLRLFREENIVGRIFDFLKNHPDVKFADQTAINYLLGSRVKFVPDKWQMLAMKLNDEILDSGCAIHFAGAALWKKVGYRINTITDTMLLWYTNYSYYSGESLRVSLSRLYHVGTAEMIMRRILFLCAVLPIIRQLYFLFLFIIGKKYHIFSLKKWCLPLRWRRI